MKSKGIFFINFGLILMLASFALIFFNLYEESEAKRSASLASIQLNEMILDKTDFSLLENSVSFNEKENYLINPYMEMPIETVEDRDYIGVLEIEPLNLELPILSAWSYPNLKLSPCRYKGSVYLDNMILCAHNYTSHFGQFKYLNPGDKIHFTDVDGNQFHYLIDYIEILSPTDVEELEAGQWDLTLFTCTVGGRSRIVVRCTRQDDFFEIN